MRKFVEFLAWMQIVISPLIVAVIGGGIFYLYFQGLTRIIGWILIGLVGLILGIVFANRVTRKTSATEFISRIDASPELDNNNKNPH